MARIMVVEDEPIVGMQLQESLEDAGYTVPEVVDSGDAVMGAVLAQKPDLIIMDINLKSFIDGVDAAARVRLVSDVPIIFLTAYPSQGSQDRALKTRPAAYMLKPINDRQLLDSVERALSPSPQGRPVHG
ncbi:MAG TPA: response regulator [Rectinemataceae bacterium]|nr:response regulator [Rectinemataceae bacterium]